MQGGEGRKARKTGGRQEADKTTPYRRIQAVAAVTRADPNCRRRSSSSSRSSSRPPHRRLRVIRLIRCLNIPHRRRHRGVVTVRRAGRGDVAIHHVALRAGGAVDLGVRSGRPVSHAGRAGTHRRLHLRVGRGWHSESQAIAGVTPPRRAVVTKLAVYSSRCGGPDVAARGAGARANARGQAGLDSVFMS